MGRYYYKNTYEDLGAHYNVTARHPFDVRDIVETFTDLLSAKNTFNNNVYEGMRVLVLDEGLVYELISQSETNRGTSINKQFAADDVTLGFNKENKKLWKRLTIETITTGEALNRAKNNLVNGALIYLANSIQDGDVIISEGLYFCENGELKAASVSIGGSGTGDGVQSDWEEVDVKSLAYIKNKPVIPTKMSELDNDAEYAKESDVANAINNLVGQAPGTLNTIEALAEALNNNPDVVDDLNESITKKADKTTVDALSALLDTSVKKISINMSSNRLEATDSSNNNYFVNMTKLVKPNAPSINTIEYDVVTGDATVVVVNNHTSSTLKYSTDRGATWSNVPTEGVNLASGFDTNEDNRPKSYTLSVKATLNGVDSDVATYTITINPKVASPTLSVVRTPNDNDWATKATITMTASSYKDATSYYKIGDKDWQAFTETKTFETSSVNTVSGMYKVKATREGYVDSDVVNSTEITLNNKKAYYGFSIKASGLTITEVESMQGSKEASTFASGTSVTITEVPEGAYIWLCCTETIGTVYSDAAKQHEVAFESKVTIGSYNCYRIAKGVTSGNHTFYF